MARTRGTLLPPGSTYIRSAFSRKPIVCLQLQRFVGLNLEEIAESGNAHLARAEREQRIAGVERERAAGRGGEFLLRERGGEIVHPIDAQHVGGVERDARRPRQGGEHVAAKLGSGILARG
jgi:hypothetical protein